jgi:MraZ protein
VDETGDKPPFLGITQNKTQQNHMLLGEYKHNLDTKGRMAIPAKFRDKLNAGAIITRGIDNCLFVFALAEWENLAAKLIALPLAQANSRAFVRLMLAGASDVALDNQGRILIPDYLRKYAGLKKGTVVAGLYNRIEIWDEAAWDTYKSKTENASEQIAEQLGELGI